MRHTHPQGPPDHLTVFLRACAIMELDARGQTWLARVASQVRNWNHLADRAEDHGIAPLVRRHVTRSGIDLPATTSTQLAALAIRHREGARVLTQALLDVVRALHAAGIEHIVLKGAVLAHDIYPGPELRPLRDLDILVAPEAAHRTWLLLRDLGFTEAQPSRSWASHHHLPAVARALDGHQVTVEVHQDAMSSDQPERLTLETVTVAPRTLRLQGQEVFAFGHTDMLRHLTAHLLQPRVETRLLGVVDLVGYAAHYATEIDWERIERAQPRVTNALRLMRYLHPLPDSLSFLTAGGGQSPPRGIGYGLPLLGSVALRNRPGTTPVRALLYPSEWWMRAYYGVPETRPLTPTRWMRHLPRIAYWGLRRVLGRPRRDVVRGRLRAMTAANRDRSSRR